MAVHRGLVMQTPQTNRHGAIIASYLKGGFISIGYQGTKPLAGNLLDQQLAGWQRAKCVRVSEVETKLSLTFSPHELWPHPRGHP